MGEERPGAAGPHPDPGPRTPARRRGRRALTGLGELPARPPPQAALGCVASDSPSEVSVVITWLYLRPGSYKLLLTNFISRSIFHSGASQTRSSARWLRRFNKRPSSPRTRGPEPRTRAGRTRRHLPRERVAGEASLVSALQEWILGVRNVKCLP